MPHPHGASLPSSAQVQAAHALAQAWEHTRPRGSVAKPLFDYGVSLLLWRNAFSLQAGIELFEEKLPLGFLTLGVLREPHGAPSIGLPTSIEFGFGPDDYTLDVREEPETLALTLCDNEIVSAVSWHNFPLSPPLLHLDRPEMLLRMFDLLLEFPSHFNKDATEKQNARQLIDQHLTSLPHATHGPHAPVPLFILLRDLRVVIDMDEAVEDMLEQAKEGLERRQIVGHAALEQRAHWEAVVERGGFLVWAEWKALAHRALKYDHKLKAWIDRFDSSLERFDLLLLNEDVALAQARLELSLEKVSPRHPFAFERTVGETLEEGLRDHNVANWKAAHHYLKEFCGIVTHAPHVDAQAHGERSLAKRSSAARAYEPRARWEV